MQTSAAKLASHGFSIVIFLVIIAYPLLSIFGIQKLSTIQFAWILLTAFISRSVFLYVSRGYTQWPLTLCVVIFCMIVILLNSDKLLQFYPVLMNAGIGLLFLTSLLNKHSFIEQLLITAGKEPPAKAINYIRGLCLVWGIFLMLNASIAAYTACCTNKYIWAMYNGVISYIAIAIFFAVEITYRTYYKRVNEQNDDGA